MRAPISACLHSSEHLHLLVLPAYLPAQQPVEHLLGTVAAHEYHLGQLLGQPPLHHRRTDVDALEEALDGTGNVTATHLYAPYGRVRYSSGTMPTAKGFTGQRADSATGLDYYGARYYDPALGQFTSGDTDFVCIRISRYVAVLLYGFARIEGQVCLCTLSYIGGYAVGTDIHGWLEVKDRGVHRWYGLMRLDLLPDRAYGMFGFLFGVRNTSPFTPVAQGRGLPQDASDDVTQDYEAGSVSPTWITWREITAIDWDEESRPLVHSGQSFGARKTRKGYLTKSWQTLFDVMATLAAYFGEDRVRLTVWFDQE